MTETESTSPQAGVETTNPAQEVATDQAAGQGDNEGQPRDDKGRFANKEGEPELDPSALEALTDGQPPEEEVEEIDWDGKRYAVPKPLKEGLMRQQDYTRKTQEVAQQRKENEEAKARYQQLIEQQQTDFEEQVALHTLSKYLESLRDKDWLQASKDDPLLTQQQYIEYQALRDQYGDRSVKLKQKQHERALQTQRESAKREEEGREKLRNTIKDYSPEMESILKAHAKERGIKNADQLQFALHPEETQILHDAYLYRQLMKKAQQKPKAPDPKPVNTVGQSGRSSPQGLSDDLSTEEWAKRFRAIQLRK